MKKEEKIDLDELEDYLLVCPLLRESRKAIEESLQLPQYEYRTARLHLLAELVGGHLDQLIEDLEEDKK